MERRSTEARVPVPSSHPAAEDAWELARRLSHVVDGLVELEHDEFRLAGALAATLTDELEAIIQRRAALQARTRGPS